MSQHVDIILDANIIEAAERRDRSISGIQRDKGSKNQSLVGILGEMIFVQWLWGDWRCQHPSQNHGQPDVAGRIEVKCSGVPISRGERMICREDYMERRSPDYYVQVIIDINSRVDSEIRPGMTARIAGWTDHATFAAAGKERLVDKFGKPQNYMSYVLYKQDWKPMGSFPVSEFPAPKILSPLALLKGGI